MTREHEWEHVPRGIGFGTTERCPVCQSERNKFFPEYPWTYAGPNDATFKSSNPVPECVPVEE